MSLRFFGGSSGGSTTDVGLLAARPSAATAGSGAGYFATDDNGGTLHLSDGTNWHIAGPRSVELGFTNITSDLTTSSTTVADATGLSVAVTVRDRPIMVEFHCGFVSNSNASGLTELHITKSDNTVLKTGYVKALTASGGGPATLSVRQNPGAGAQTYKVRWRAVTAGTSTISAASIILAYIRVYEV